MCSTDWIIGFFSPRVHKVGERQKRVDMGRIRRKINTKKNSSMKYCSEKTDLVGLRSLEMVCGTVWICKLDTP